MNQDGWPRTQPGDRRETVRDFSTDRQQRLQVVNIRQPIITAPQEIHLTAPDVCQEKIKAILLHKFALILQQDPPPPLPPSLNYNQSHHLSCSELQYRRLDDLPDENV